MWIMPLHLYVNQKSNYDDDVLENQYKNFCFIADAEL